MTKLNLPSYSVRIKENNGKKKIFDFIRKKFVALTPEEWVRQHFLNFLVKDKGFPPSLIAVEMPVLVNGLNQRSDIVIYSKHLKPLMLIECKAPGIKLTHSVFDQAARYNGQLKVSYIGITNGLTHYCAKIGYAEPSFQFLKEFPNYEEMI